LDFTLNMIGRLDSSALGKAINILPRADQRKILIITLVQILMGGLDLLGVLAIGLLGALSVTGLQSTNPGSRVSAVLEFLHIQDASFQHQAVILGTSAVLLLVGRTVLSILFTRKTLFFLSRRGAQISTDLISRLLSQSLLVVQSRTTQETVYAVTTGVERIVLQVLGTTVIWIADFALLCVMMFGLLVVDPITAIFTFFVFTLVGYFLYRFMHLRAGNLGVENSKLNIRSDEKIVEVFTSYRESVVRNRRDYYAREMGHLRYSLASTSAELAFLPFVSKYVIETTVVVGAVLIGATQFFFQDVSQAVATLAVFLAAGTRIAPAVLRLQQGTLNIISGLGVASPTLKLIEELGSAPLTENKDDKLDVKHEGFVSRIEIDDVSFSYPNKALPAITSISLTIPAGSSVAFVGASGAGKTTMVDVLLGVLNPIRGSVSVSGLPPMLAVAKWPGAVSYVPQDIVISSGTIRENIALGYPIEEATDELIMRALKLAQLDEYVASLPDGIDTQVGERGTRISGGQRQRLGIARAMFTQPHLLVLDEATSSLDGETEASISNAIHALKGSTTVVIIAHRLSTIKNVDKVVYLSDGKIMATGTFDQVRNRVPNFDLQAKIMGL
jgi:ABC-type multidrug transport system fused ATPase/permease subunit